ncbi:MAG: glycosyltransferase involved in cell wall biosynthesis [Planctomycetaceae bacterium]
MKYFEMSVPRRISFLITELDHGGAERALVRIVTELDRSLWEPHVISLSDRGPLAEPLEEAGIPVTAIGAGRVRSPAGLWRATVGLTRCLKEQQPAVLQTFLFHANIAGRLAARRAGVPAVVSGIRVAEKRGRWRLNIDRWTEQFVDRHVCVSQSVADFSIRESGLSRSKVVVIPNGVDVERFAAAKPADLSVFGIPAGARTILSVGRLDEQKNPLGLLRSFAAIAEAHPQTHLLFVGDGPEEAALQAAIAESKLESRVHLAGWQADVPGIMRACDLFVLASKWEGMPNVLLEAGAAGIPVVSTLVEGAEEIITSGESGVLVGISQPSELAAAMSECLTDPSAANGRADRLQSVVSERFTWDSVVAGYSEVYESLLT